ncbi:MAG: PilZ domain-containing protein [Myxococcota bacterium]
MSADRRKLTRHALVQYLQVYDQQTKDMIGRVVDVSRGGMMLVGNQPYEADGDPRRLKLVLPKTFEAKDSIEVEAACRWSARDVNDQLFDGGFEFVNVNEDLKDTLDLVVDELAFGGSLRADDDEFEDEYEYEV